MRVRTAGIFIPFYYLFTGEKETPQDIHPAAFLFLFSARAECSNVGIRLIPSL